MRPERFHRLRAVLLRRQPDLTLLMDGVHKTHNFSAILRNCDAAGVLEVHMVDPERGVDVHHGTSAGTRKWIRVHRYANTAEAADRLRKGGFGIVAAHPSRASVDFRDVDYTEPVAIMMGAELHGVSDTGRRLADVHVEIPMLGMAHSLNVSVATSLLLFEALRQRQAAGMYDACRLGPERFERLLFEWTHPAIARQRRLEGRAYPRLTEDGEIVRDW